MSSEPTPAEILARFAASWHNRRFMTIDNESDEGRQFLGAVEAALAEREQLHAEQHEVALPGLGLNDHAEA